MPVRYQLALLLMTAESIVGGVVVTGSNNRTAGRNYNEKT